MKVPSPSGSTSSSDCGMPVTRHFRERATSVIATVLAQAPGATTSWLPNNPGVLSYRPMSSAMQPRSMRSTIVRAPVSVSMRKGRLSIASLIGVSM